MPANAPSLRSGLAERELSIFLRHGMLRPVDYKKDYN